MRAVSKDIVGDAMPTAIHAIDDATGDFGGSIRFEDGAIATARRVDEDEDEDDARIAAEKAEIVRDAAMDARVSSVAAVGVRVPIGLMDVVVEIRLAGEGRVRAEWTIGGVIVEPSKKREMRFVPPELRVQVLWRSGPGCITRWFTLCREFAGTNAEATPENVRAFVRKALARK